MRKKKFPRLIEMTKLCTCINLLVPSSFGFYSLLFLSFFFSILTTGVLIDRYHLGRFWTVWLFSTILVSVAFDDVMTGFL